MLENTFKNSLELTEENELIAIAFPTISVGAYRHPTQIVAEVTKKVADSSDFESVEKAIFCLYSEDDYNTFKSIFY